MYAWFGNMDRAVNTMSHHHEWVLMWVNSPRREWHICSRVKTLELSGEWIYTLFKFSLQITNASCFNVLCCWFAHGLPGCPGHSQGFVLEKMWCRIVQTVLVSSVLSARTPGAIVELSIEGLLRNACVVHTNDMPTLSKLCSGNTR